MISTCLSIAQDIDSNCFAVAVINFPHQTIANELFSPDGKPIDPTNRYEDIWDFMERELSDPDTTQVIIAVPTILEVRRVESIPVIALETNSIYLKILQYLSAKNYCAFLNLTSDKAKGVVLVTPSCVKTEELTKNADSLAVRQQKLLQAGVAAFLMAPLSPTDWVEEGGSADPPPHKLIILHPTVANAYARFVFEASVDFDNGLHPSWAVTAAALIAETDGLYYYFASEGIVQSSQDIVEHFRSANSFIKSLGYDDIFQTGFLPSYPDFRSPVVSHAQEVYTMLMSPYTRVDNIDQIPLKYAVAMNKYQKSSHMSEADSQKFALLTICKLWRIPLYCRRLEFEYLFRSHQNDHLVYPSPSADREFVTIY